MSEEKTRAVDWHRNAYAKCEVCGARVPVNTPHRALEVEETEASKRVLPNGAGYVIGYGMDGGPAIVVEEGVRGLITEECDALRVLLLAKNAAYGNSALEPVRVFSKADPEEQIRVRLDDKLSRLARGSAAGEDVEQDLLGYLILLRVQRKMKQRGIR